MPPVISVIVPVYNAAETLDDCLQSITTQSFREIEIICVNDGSTDGSTEILRRAAATDPRIILLEQENRGANAAKNRAVEAASGAFLGFVDSDDRLLPDALGKLLSAFNSDEIDIAHGGHENRDEHGKRRRHPVKRRTLRPPECLRALLRDAIHRDPWANLFRRSLLVDRRLRFPETYRSAIDVVFVTQAFFFARAVQLVPDLVYSRTLRRDSLSNNSLRPAHFRERVQARAEVADFIRSQGQWEIYEAAVRDQNSRFFRKHLLRVVRDARGHCEISLRETVQYCNATFTEFTITDLEAARVLLQILADQQWQIRQLSQADRAAVVDYAAAYLRTISRENLVGLERQAVDLLCDVPAGRLDWRALARVLPPSRNLPPLWARLARGLKTAFQRN